MKHLFIKGENPAKTLVLFHGTGGNEEDLIPLARIIDPSANVLSLRGSVTENGMNRFFRRLSEGIFDEADIRTRALEITEFLDDAIRAYALNREELIALGYSNGANIIAAIHYLHGRTFKKSILFHPMVPLQADPVIDLQGLDIFIGAGENDPIVPIKNTRKLEDTLTEKGATVALKTYQKGHSLTLDEVNDAKMWYEK